MTAPGGSDSVVIGEFTGLNNTVAEERLKPGELAVAKNIDIDDRGHVRRRRGRTLLLSGAFHSLWTAQDGRVFVVWNGTLCRLTPSNGLVQLAATVGDASVVYVQVGDGVYFSSTMQSGVIDLRDGVTAWGTPGDQPVWVSPVARPTVTLPDTRGKWVGSPPAAQALAHYNGRIYLAHDRTLWATELYQYHRVDRTRTFLMFEAPITVLGAVGNGLYVGTETAVYFLQGARFAEFRRETVLRVGAVAGSMVEVPAEAVSPPQLRENGISQTRPAVVFLTADGLCAGLDSGQCYNLTESQMVFPEAQHAAAMYRQQDGIGQYIAVTSTDGPPASNARFGDYVDAEIRRFTGA